MEMSRLFKKEMINLHDGSRLGHVGDADLIIDETGAIRAFVIYPRGIGGRWGKNTRELVIPWEAVKKVGEDVMVVEIEPASLLRRLGSE